MDTTNTTADATTTAATVTVTVTAPADVQVQTVTVDGGGQAKAAPAPKPQKFVIFQDAQGAEIGRKPMGRGRPPRDSVVDADGNRIVKNATKAADGSFELPQAPVAKTDIFYVTVDANGNEVSRESKGRGRPRPGYVRHEKGAFAGHWVGAPVVKAPKPAKATKAAKADEAPAVETPATAEVPADTSVEPEGQEMANVTGAMPSLANA
jgi:hypothetical protein